MYVCAKAVHFNKIKYKTSILIKEKIMDSLEFVKSLKEANEPLFKASEMQVEAYFASNPSKEKLVDHFIGRMVNERMNMVEISNQVANMPADADPVEIQNISKQAFDEAVHFRMVKEVIEHMTGEPLDVEKAIVAEAAKPTAKGADLLAKYEADTDPLALACYQFIAEGRAERVWHKMADCIEDQFIATSYAKIGTDEGFHSNIGRLKLEKLCTDAETQLRASELAKKMRVDLYSISCMNTKPLADAKAMFEAAEGVTIGEYVKHDTGVLFVMS